GRVDRRRGHDRLRLLPGLADRRARGPVAARPLLRRGGTRPLRPPRGPSQPPQAAQQPGRDQLPARRDHAGRGLPQGGVPARARARERRRRRLRDVLARAGTAEDRRAGAGRAAREARARAPRGAGRPPRRDGERAARARTRAPRPEPARRGRAGLPRGPRKLRAARLRQSPRRRVDRAGGARLRPRRRLRGGRALQACRRDPAGLPLLEEVKTVKMVRLIPVLTALLTLAAFVGRAKFGAYGFYSG